MWRMNALIALLGASLISGIVSATDEDWEPVVLKATSLKDNGSKITITLVSGDIIQVSKKDWSSAWSKGVADALKREQAEKRTRSMAEPPSDADASAVIRAKCTKEWPDDFSMRNYCEEKQLDAFRKLNR